MRLAPTATVEAIGDVLGFLGMKRIEARRAAGEGGDDEEDGDGTAGDGEVARAEEAGHGADWGRYKRFDYCLSEI